MVTCSRPVVLATALVLLGLTGCETASSSPAPAIGDLSAKLFSYSSVRLAWSDPSDDLTGYEVERGTGEGEEWTSVATVAGDALGWDDAQLAPSTVYRYRVRATNDAGASEWSNVATVRTAPAAPTELKATTLSGTSIRLTWKGNAAEGTGFRLDRTLEGSGVWVRVIEADVTTLSHDDTGLLQGTAYTYRVRTVTPEGLSAWSASVTASTRPAPPVAPSGLRASVRSSSTLRLAWTDNSNNETGFQMWRSPDGTTGWTNVGTAQANATWWDNTGLAPGTKYFYRIRAVNSGGASPFTSVVNATTSSVPPAVPSDLVATATSPTAIHLAWTDNANDETGFEVERSLNGTTGWSSVGAPAANTTSWDDTTAAESTAYYYRVRATGAGNPSSFSNTANSTTPAAVSGLSARTTSHASVLLRWTERAGDETGFEIERSPNGTTGWVSAGNAVAGATSWHETGLAAGNHSYRVRATRGAGPSAWSNTAAATARAAPASATRELFVASAGSTRVSVLDAASSAGPLRVFGSLTALASPSAVAVDSAHGELFGANQGSDSVTVYALAAEGNVAPVRTLAGTATTLEGPTAIALDTVNDELHVASATGVAVFSRTATGNTAPVRSLSGASTGLDGVVSLFVDSANDELFSVTSGGVRVHARTATGDTAPLRTLAGAATGLSGPTGVTVDVTNNELLVANGTTGTFTVYSRTADGNVAPTRTLSGKADARPAGLRVDNLHDELFAVNGDGSLVAYNRTASGATTPVRTVSGASSQLVAPSGVALAGDEVFVVDAQRGFLATFERTANGNVAPKRRVTSAGYGLETPIGVAVDVTHGEVFVADQGSGSVVVYLRLAEAADASLRRITGVPDLSSARGIAVDAGGDELYIATGTGVRVYDRMADGAATPKRSFTAAGWSVPLALAVDAANDEVLVATTSGSLLAFSRTASGTVAALRTVTGFGRPSGVALDATNAELFVSDATPNALVAIDRTATGSLAAKRTVQGAGTSLATPWGIAVDPVGNEVFAANRATGSITFYARTADGDTAPLRSTGAGLRWSEHLALGSF